MSLLNRNTKTYPFSNRLYEILSGKTPGYDVRFDGVKDVDWKNEEFVITPELTTDSMFSCGIPSWKIDESAEWYAEKIGTRYSKTNIYYNFTQRSDSIEFSYTLGGSAYDPMQLFRALQKARSLKDIQVEIFHANAHPTIDADTYVKRFTGAIVEDTEDRPALDIPMGTPSVEFIQEYIDAKIAGYGGRGSVHMDENGHITHTRVGETQQGLIEDTLKDLVSAGLIYVSDVTGSQTESGWSVTVQLRHNIRAFTL